MANTLFQGIFKLIRHTQTLMDSFEVLAGLEFTTTNAVATDVFFILVGGPAAAATGIEFLADLFDICKAPFLGF